MTRNVLHKMSAPNLVQEKVQHVRQVLLDILARDHAVVAVLDKKLDPVLEPVFVQRHAVLGHQRIPMVHLMPPGASTPISSAQ